jgi:colanic acid biosynthesis glycosyl transferase WcaI
MLSDIGLITQQRTVSNIVFPSKAVTLLASGCPIIGSVASASDIARVLSESGAAVVVPPEDPESLADAISSLRREPARLSAMRKAGKLFAQRTWHHDNIYPVMEQYLTAAARHRSLDSPPPAAPAEYSAKITGDVQR